MKQIMKKKRRAETLTEFLVASLLFLLSMVGVSKMGGIFDFMASHTELLAKIRDRDYYMYRAQWIMNHKDFCPSQDISAGAPISYPHYYISSDINAEKMEEDVSFDWIAETRTLYIFKDNTVKAFNDKSALASFSIKVGSFDNTPPSS